MANTLSIWVNRHVETVKVSHVSEIDTDTVMPEFVVLKMKPKHWVKDTFGDGLWHGWVTADREPVARLLRLR